jgi:hypothetical protein
LAPSKSKTPNGKLHEHDQKVASPVSSDVAFDPDCGGPKEVTFDSLTDWTKRPEDGIRFHSGVAIYRKSFDVPVLEPEKSGKTWLDLGRVRLNGRDLGIVWTAPWRVDITEALRPGGLHGPVSVLAGE